MESLEGNLPFRHGNDNPASHFDGLSRYTQPGRQIFNPSTNHERIPDTFSDSQYASRCRQNGQSIHGEHPQRGVEMYNPSPFPTDKSWSSRDGYWTPELPPKRRRSQSSIDPFPSKRTRVYDSPGMTPLPSPMPPSRHGLYYERSRDFDGYWGPREHTADLGVVHPFSNLSSSQRSIIVNRYDHSAERSSPYSYETQISTPRNTVYGNPKPYMNDAVQTLDQRPMPRTHKVVGATRPNHHDKPSRIAPLNVDIEQATPPLQSPLWIARGSREQPPKIAQNCSPRPQNSAKTPKKNKRLAGERVYPFDDGGVRGHGGSSSDEDTMMFPVVEGRNVHMGGYRLHEAVDKEAYKTSPSNDFTPLDSAIDLNEVWQATDRVNRRGIKLKARDFSARWRVAQENGDVAGMEKLERRAKKAVIPLRKGPAEHKDGHPQAIAAALSLSPHNQVAQPLRLPPKLPSSAAQCDYDIRFLENGGLVPYGEQATRHRYQSQEFFKYGTADDRRRYESQFLRSSQIRNLHDGGRNENRFMRASDSPYQADQHDFQDYTAKQDSTPWEKAFRTSQNNRQRLNVDATPYRAETVLPKASIAYNDRPNPTDMDNDPHLPPIFSCSVDKDHLGNSEVVKSEARSRRVPRTSNSQTPHWRPRPLATNPGPHFKSSQEVIDLISSAESSPIHEPSKPMRDRLALASEKRAAPKQSTSTNTAGAPSKKIFAKEQIDPEEARQQRAANTIVATELKAVNDDDHLEAEAFGALLDLSPKQEEALAKVKRQEEQRKEEAMLREEIAQEEASLEEMKKQKEITEARQKERLVKEREEQSKILKRQQNRKKQLAMEEMIKDEKRKQTVARIEAQRAKDKADAEAREKEKEKNRSIEYDKLKIELMKKDLELKRLQAASLSVAKASSPEASQPPFALAEDQNSLFVPRNTQFKDLDMGDVDASSSARSVVELFGSNNTFRRMMAADRDSLKAERALEARKKAEATKLRRLDAISKLKEPIKDDPKRVKTSRSTLKNHAAWPASSSEETQSASATPFQRSNSWKTIDFESFEDPKSNSAPDCSVLPLIPAPPPPKAYSSEVRLISDVELEKVERERQVREELVKRQRLAERRQAALPQIALKQRTKILTEAKNAGYNIDEKELEIRVNHYMEKLEEAYQKKQAKKALKSGVSFVSSSMSQAETQQKPSLSSTSSETEQGNAGTDTEEQNSSRIEVSEEIAAAKRERGGRYAQAVAKRTVSDLATDLQCSDSEDASEEDPDDDQTLEAMIAAKIGAKSVAQGSEKQARDPGGLNPDDGETECGDRRNGGSGSQRATPQPSANSSASKNIGSRSEQPIQEEDRRIKIYNVKKNQTKDGEELDEVVRKLHIREEANDMAKDMLKQYRDQAAGEEQSFSSQMKEGLYHGKVALDDQNSMTICVRFEFATASEFGLEISNMDNLHGEKVWVIKWEHNKTLTDEAGNTVITLCKDDATDFVYTDRKLANHKAAQALIDYLKPPEGLDVQYETAWANEWSPDIWEAEKACREADECFEMEIDRSELLGAAWLKDDTAKFWVEAVMPKSDQGRGGG